MAGAGFRWEVTPTSAWGDLVDNYYAAIQRGVFAIVLRRAPEVEAWMRSNAPWIDRTGNARQTLHTAVSAMTNEITLYLAHGVTYGVYLELRHSGRYSVIGPALDEFAPVIWNDVKAMMGQ
jgi:hypothetical protein